MMCTKDLTAQAMAFDPVLPPKGQPQALTLDEEGHAWIHIRADEAGRVALRVYNEEYPFVKEADGIWHLRFPFTDGMTYVQLLIDGTEVLTPYLPMGYGYSRPYNCVILEEQEDFYRLKEVPHGSLRREYYLSCVTREWESCTVYTPPGYDAQPNRKYPVLYLQHGHGENETGWIYAGKVNFILDNLIASGDAVPFVAVMNNGMVQTAGGDGTRAVDHTLFPELLVKDIIPFIESAYRIIGDREHRAMAGLSMGSIQTSITAFSYPELFSCAGLFSGFLRDFLQGGELDMMKREPSQNRHLRVLEDAEKFRRDYRVFFRGIGKADAYIEHFLEDDKILEEKGVSGIRRLYEGGHDWNVWRRCIRDFAKLIFQPNPLAKEETVRG